MISYIDRHRISVSLSSYAPGAGKTWLAVTLAQICKDFGIEFEYRGENEAQFLDRMENTQWDDARKALERVKVIIFDNYNPELKRLKELVAETEQKAREEHQTLDAERDTLR
jgi:hypothetical protein